MVTPFLSKHKPLLSDSVLSPCFWVHDQRFRDGQYLTTAEPLPVLLLLALADGTLRSETAAGLLLCQGAGCGVNGCTRAWRPAAKHAPPACVRCGVTTEPLEPLSDDDPDNWDSICFDWNACEARLVQQEAN